jgi:hypothetical protein
MPEGFDRTNDELRSILDVNDVRALADEAFQDRRTDGARDVVERALENAPAIDALVQLAAEALSGNARAAGSLRRRLSWRMRTPLTRPDLIDSRSRLDADALGVLLAGAVWSAGSAEEANVLVDVALRLVEPLVLAAAAVDAAARTADSEPSSDLLEHLIRGVSLGRWLLEIPDDGPPLGPDDAPLGPFRPDDVPPQWSLPVLIPIEMDYLSPAVCVFAAMQHIGELQRQGPRYSITSVDPPSVCRSKVSAGGGKPTLLTISGTGFGTSGTVVFHVVDDPDDVVEVAASAWSDDLITVIVPPDVASGTVELRIKFTEVTMCGRTFDVYRLADKLVTLDAESVAYDITVNGVHPPAIFEPATIATVSFLASASPATLVTVNVTVTDLKTGAVLAPATTIHQQHGGGAGSFQYTLPAAGAPHVLLFELLVYNGCAHGHEYRAAAYTIAPVVSLEVYSLEVTQGYQHHPGGVSQSAPAPPLPPDQLVVSIADKDTIVRAYVGVSGAMAFDPTMAGVTGVLRVDGKALLPLAPTVTARQTVTRRPIDSTLNFRIPAAWCTGTRELALAVSGLDAAGRSVSASYKQMWTWVHAHPLKVRWVHIIDTRKPPVYKPVNDSVALSLLQCAFTHLPSPYTDLAPAVVRTMTSNMNPRDHSIDKDGAVTEYIGFEGLSGMADMWWELDEVREDADRPDELWVGIVGDVDAGGKSNTPSHTAIAAAKPVVIAHEIGHTRGLNHSPGTCPGSPPPDDVGPPLPPDYFLSDVAVWLYDETTLTPALATVDPPPPNRTLGDLMSYCCVRATSPRTWTAVFVSLP